MSTKRTVPPAGAGPYIVTTKQEHLDGWKPLSRVAVATLNEARKVPFFGHDVATEENWGDLAVSLMELPESGGTIGPLPDGTVIEVVPATDGELRAACPLIFSSEWIRMSLRERCVAYNARQERS